ncbi:hypothetical protein BG74_07710 [Sodalis-like endosymbiont of Proechinophthirus fluctus]|nr:hypothetical protein BG74_07710 [Sodalis-like endosymbiont of Proechinophthirus fluctus]
MLFAPAFYRFIVDMLVQFDPVRVIPAGSTFVQQWTLSRCCWCPAPHLDVEFQILLQIAKSVFLARILLDLHQHNDVLYGHLGRRELGNITFDELPRLQHIKWTVCGGLNFAGETKRRISTYLFYYFFLVGQIISHPHPDLPLFNFPILWSKNPWSG